MLDLGRYPANELRHVLEADFDVLIIFSDLGSEGSAACTSGDFGQALLVNSQDAPWRRNFDIAHELFHLLTWNATVQHDETDERLEKLANVFAANLLLPTEQVSIEIKEIIDEQGAASWIDFVELARRFDVSTEALLWRFHTLGYLNQEQVQSLLNSDEFRSLDRLSMRGLWSQPPELPERYVRLAFYAFVKECISKAKLAEILETSLIDLPSRLAEYGLAENEELQKSVNTR